MSEMSATPDADATPVYILTSVYGARDGDMLLLDRKAIEGLEYRASLWPGRLAWLLSFHAKPPSYSGRYDPSGLPFDIVGVRPDRSDVAKKLPANAILCASADNFNDLGLAEALPGRVIYTIEYSLATRLDILRSAKISPLRKLRQIVWTLLMERRRRRAIAAAAGLQCNGLPSYRQYARLNPHSMFYFDSRMSNDMMIGRAAIEAKQEAIMSPGALRLAFSGRLERMKGAHYLLPLIRSLDRVGLDFVFEIFGDGALREEFEQAAAGELAGKLKVHGPVDFATELVSAMQERVELFVCPHPQGDPSCTYMETLSCGVPIAGFANEAWGAMVEGESFGGSVPVGDVEALAQMILALDKDRVRLAAMAREAAAFSAARSFEAAFARRVDHWRDVIKATPALNPPPSRSEAGRG